MIPIDLDVPESGSANFNGFKLALVKTFLNLLTPNKGLEVLCLEGLAKTAFRPLLIPGESTARGISGDGHL
ncbi:MAG: hypothetical protein ACP5EL_05030 [Methanocrinis sp.]